MGRSMATGQRTWSRALSCRGTAPSRLPLVPRHHPRRLRLGRDRARLVPGRPSGPRDGTAAVRDLRRVRRVRPAADGRHRDAWSTSSGRQRRSCGAAPRSSTSGWRSWPRRSSRSKRSHGWVRSVSRRHAADAGPARRRRSSAPYNQPAPILLPRRPLGAADTPTGGDHGSARRQGSDRHRRGARRRARSRARARAPRARRSSSTTSAASGTARGRTTVRRRRSSRRSRRSAARRAANFDNVADLGRRREHGQPGRRDLRRPEHPHQQRRHPSRQAWPSTWTRPSGTPSSPSTARATSRRRGSRARTGARRARRPGEPGPRSPDPHVVGVGPVRQRRTVQLRLREGRPHLVLAVHRARDGEVRRHVERDRAARTHADDRRHVRQHPEARGLRRVGPGQRRAVGRLPVHRAGAAHHRTVLRRHRRRGQPDRAAPRRRRRSTRATAGRSRSSSRSRPSCSATAPTGLTQRFPVSQRRDELVSLVAELRWTKTVGPTEITQDLRRPDGQQRLRDRRRRRRSRSSTPGPNEAPIVLDRGR